MLHKVLGFLSVFAVSGVALASDGGGNPLAAIGAGLAIGLAAFGGALGQGRAAAGAYEAMGRNPKANVFVPFILGLALIESLVIYGLIIAFQLAGKA
jgi:F-type H+-transporting ATPase subunit c